MNLDVNSRLGVSRNALKSRSNLTVSRFVSSSLKLTKPRRNNGT